MKRLIGFCIFVVVLICLFLFFSRRAKNYELEYDKDGFNIVEKFDKNNSNYYFNLNKESYEYDYVLDHKYSNKRKVVEKISEIDKDDYKCISVSIFDYETPYICNKNNEYADGYLVGTKNNNEEKEIKKVDQISVYSDEYDYYRWTGYGISSILDAKEYNFLSNESYDNNLSYQLGEYLIIADYDQTREFNKFYIFNFKTKKISEWEFDYKISFNSYFMGDYDDYIYLFDKKNKKQYKINVKSEKMEISSDNEGALYYNNGWDTIGLNKLVYNDICFEDTSLINYSIVDDKIYYNYLGSDKKIQFDSGDISAFIDMNNNDVFYLKKDSLYKYNIDSGKTKLLSYFEWNFSYSNKIFIFN